MFAYFTRLGRSCREICPAVASAIQDGGTPITDGSTRSLMIVSVVCPCRNEIDHIDAFLRTLSQQQTSGFDLEIIVADGESDDGTAEVLAAWQGKDPRIKVFSNGGQVVSTGLNTAIGMAQGEIIVRMDVHTEYAKDYVEQCVKELKQTRATCVGGPWRAKGKSLRQKAIAAAFGSAFGSGGAKSRRASYTGFVDTVYLGAWWRADLIALGGFDEQLVRNQDDELCLRIIQAGGTVWQSNAIRSHYIPRATLLELWRQFYQYGYWRAAVVRKHRLPSSLRQLTPTLFTAAVTILLVIAIASPLARLLVMGLLGTYVVAAIFAAIKAADSPATVMLVVLSFIVMHFGYGIGFAHGILDFGLLRRTSPSRP